MCAFLNSLIEEVMFKMFYLTVTFLENCSNTNLLNLLKSLLQGAHGFLFPLQTFQPGYQLCCKGCWLHGSHLLRWPPRPLHNQREIQISKKTRQDRRGWVLQLPSLHKSTAHPRHTQTQTHAPHHWHGPLPAWAVGHALRSLGLFPL